MSSKYNHKGFTIIELLIATAVFSLVLIIFMTSFIKIGDMFYKGVNVANTQEAARTVLDGISSDIRFSKSTPFYTAPDAAGKGIICIGQHRYKYQLDQQVGAPGAYGIQREDVNPGSCSNLSVAGSNQTELLNNRMQLNRLQLSNCGSGACTLSLLIVFYGSDNSVLVPSPTDQHASCFGNLSTAQFCATADYTTTVIENI
jgi:prepilin-type N-terminal cleavage/methylation domain-containing protein